MAFAFDRVHLFISFFIPFRHESLLVQIHFYYTRTRYNAEDFTTIITMCSLVYFTDVQTNCVLVNFIVIIIYFYGAQLRFNTVISILLLAANYPNTVHTMYCFLKKHIQLRKFSRSISTMKWISL